MWRYLCLKNSFQSVKNFQGLSSPFLLKLCCFKCNPDNKDLQDQSQERSYFGLCILEINVMLVNKRTIEIGFVVAIIKTMTCLKHY